MKKILLSVVLIATSFTMTAQVGIGTTNPNTSAALDIESKTKGFLPPRMTQAEMLAIVNPAIGLLIYSETGDANEGLWIKRSTGWEKVILSSSEETITYSTTAVFPASPTVGDEHFVTSDGTKLGEILEQHIYDGTDWIERPIVLNSSLQAEHGTFTVNNNITIGAAFELNSSSASNNIVVTNNSEINLKAGVTYELVANLMIRSTWANYQFYDVTNSTYLGKPGASISANSTDNASPVATYALFTPSTDVLVELILKAGSTITASEDSGGVSVKAIAGQLPVSASTTFSDLIDSDDSNVSSGYVDIGTVRIQWGTESVDTTTGTTTLPASFAAGTPYSLTAQILANTATNLFDIQINTKTPSNFSWRKNYTDGTSVSGASGEDFDWIAIGVKP
jgi:hypothetical protein